MLTKTKTTKTTAAKTTKATKAKAPSLRITPEVKAALAKLLPHATKGNIAYERELAADLLGSSHRGERAVGREHDATAKLYEALRAAR